MTSTEAPPIIHEQVSNPVTHMICDGIYIRQIRMEAGQFIMGKKHKTRHFNTVVQGKVLRLFPDTKEIVAIGPGETFVSEAGEFKVLFIIEPTIWHTIHHCGKEEDIPTLEHKLVEDYTEAEELTFEDTFNDFYRLIDHNE